ncbi:hypothetical protein BE15_30860 [Sorangium cellulosum]|uniref:Uncharacterized protein n=1 Tax=Sorangium cellulosum TaxID=56 RepID=A0A150QLW4_SORCE|nr:hypothetical protein BE15_30860 [Sorangium cellulosum]
MAQDIRGLLNPLVDVSAVGTKLIRAGAGDFGFRPATRILDDVALDDSINRGLEISRGDYLRLAVLRIIQH